MALNVRAVAAGVVGDVRSQSADVYSIELKVPVSGKTVIKVR